MNPRQYGNGVCEGYFDDQFRRWPQTPLDFFAVATDIFFIYSPLDTPQGLWRDFVFDGHGIRAWKVSHSC